MSLKLSPNEGYVMRRLLEYANRNTIAAEMGVKRRTVDVHVKRARGKYGAETTEELLQMMAGLWKPNSPNL